MASTVLGRRYEAKKALKEYASRETLSTFAKGELQLAAGHDARAAKIPQVRFRDVCMTARAVAARALTA
ncbi:hypothetical protein [Dyella sp. C11]|uniref:hypothetical protein n=1 Tax=Dyella sp. C11 TaxID=2126991 RepID=UPI001300296B|nr:hypothetical protein [Dyella sp. C11]